MKNWLHCIPFQSISYDDMWRLTDVTSANLFIRLCFIFGKYQVKQALNEQQKLLSTIEGVVKSLEEKLFGGPKPFLLHALNKVPPWLIGWSQYRLSPQGLASHARRQLHLWVKEGKLLIFIDFSKGLRHSWLKVEKPVQVENKFPSELELVRSETTKSEKFGLSNITFMTLPVVRILLCFTAQ